MNTDVTIVTKEELQNYTIKGLLGLAKNFNIKGRHDMRKDELIVHICEAYKATQNAEPDIYREAASVGNENAVKCATTKESENDDKVEIVFCNHRSGKTRKDYVNNVQKGQIIAFAMTDKKAFSAKVTEIFQNAQKELNYVLCETKNGNKFKVPASRILWVKTADRWPNEILDMLKSNTKIDNLNN